MAATFPQRQQQLGADHTVTNFFEKTFRYPSITNWWARQMRETLLVLLNCQTQLYPKRYPAPLGETDHPQISSGSDHMRSHMGPLLGISCFLSSARMSSRWLVVGDSPPWTQNILSSTMAARGRQSKTSVQYFHTLRHPYFLRHSSQNPQTCVICLDSWFPLRSVTRPSYLTFKARSRMKVQTEYSPLSTKSPRKRQVMKGASPPILNNYSRSQNCPWISPHIVTGESTRVRLDSLARTSFALSHSNLTELYSMNQLLRTRRTIYSTVRRSLFI